MSKESYIIYVNALKFMLDSKYFSDVKYFSCAMYKDGQKGILVETKEDVVTILRRCAKWGIPMYKKTRDKMYQIEFVELSQEEIEKECERFETGRNKE